MSNAAPIPGWYTDPSNAQGLRWWDGLQWTHHTAPAQAPPPLPSAPLFTKEPVKPDVNERPVFVKQNNMPVASPAASIEPETGSKANEATGVPTAQSDTAAAVQFPPGLAAPTKHGLFGGKKELAEENERLRKALADLGAFDGAQLVNELEQLRKQKTKLSSDLVAERAKARGELDLDLAKCRAEDEQIKTALNGEIANARNELEQLNEQVVTTSEIAILQEVGIYEYSHPLDSAIAYKSALAVIQDEIKVEAKSGNAVAGSTDWTVNGSTRAGTKMVKEFSKLMLRAYNNEADNALRSMKPFALASATTRLDKSRTTISKLGSTMSILVNSNYHALRIKELELTADYLAKKSEEKELERARNVRLREEAKAQRDFEMQTAKLTKEASHYRSVVEKLRTSGMTEGLVEAEEKLAEIESAISGVADRAANIRAGYVYVISNIGSFGERMVKIGMTRRLEPMDRVRELGDASVPFRFDVHALQFSDDAVGLETALHQALESKKVNLINNRREFFYATALEVKELLANFQGNLLTYQDTSEALEWNQSENIRAGRAPAAPVNQGDEDDFLTDPAETDA